MKNAIEKAIAGVSKVRFCLATFLVMMLASMSFADGESFSTGIVAEITGIKSELYTVGAAIIGVCVVFLIYRFIKSMVRS